jgi:hypothetical protein
MGHRLPDRLIDCICLALGQGTVGYQFGNDRILSLPGSLLARTLLTGALRLSGTLLPIGKRLGICLDHLV